MRAWGIAWSRIANRSAVIFLLTSAVNAAVMVLAGFGVGAGLGKGTTSIWYGLVPAIVALVGLVLFMALPLLVDRDAPVRVRRPFGPAVRRLTDWVADTEALAFRPNWRLLGTVGYLVLDIAVLWVCLRAVGDTPPVVAVVAGYQIGYLANLIPVPGGIGVLDGGLLGALLLFGLPPAQTAAAVVLYHAIALWVPALGGTIGFGRLRRTVATGRPVLAAAGQERRASVAPAASSPASTALAQAPAASSSVPTAAAALPGEIVAAPAAPRWDQASATSATITDLAA